MMKQDWLQILNGPRAELQSAHDDDDGSSPQKKYEEID